jgi:hexosaminidase
MLDVCRHFHPVSRVKSPIDGMSRYKLNFLHLHETDDQGWRIESNKLKNLTAVGSIRDSSPLPRDRERGGGP